jgi:hypothetical protein
MSLHIGARGKSELSKGATRCSREEREREGDTV